MAHQGELLKNAIKNSGVSITHIVEELGITRPTIYRRFKDNTLDDTFVKAVNKVIGHSLLTEDSSLHQVSDSSVTPAIRQPLASSVSSRKTVFFSADNELSEQLLILQKKYILLLESYNELLLRFYERR